ncbi:hypothetical protein AMATHDRAFT_72457 [Amanita thiersii Skay4041]|uniref:Copper-fist domain-containing protein n=1 Tax=Amanita thiersii Skay4041 TaxID=703135 RepID=A0A2A9NUN4_9AGAR|nr:hypothetical protein AMATHDRAFT_72457 [Amanita thiersii Skay4041]
MSSLPLPKIYVNNKKFACESCIKGHRSSSCRHTDRPLFEIQKKGRPVSQCDKCRELRQSKKVHTKCICNPKDDRSSQRLPLASNGTKSKRYIPIIPALPNGLRDLVQPSTSNYDSPLTRHRVIDNSVDGQSNPCNCSNPRKQLSQSIASSYLNNILDAEQDLDTLAGKAVMHQNGVVNSLTIGQITSANQPLLSSVQSSPGNIECEWQHTPQLQLPPIQQSSTLSCSLQSPPPEFPTMPPISTIASIAGSGCTCGLQCACPGCIEHRGPEHVSPYRRSCADGCGTCVDERATVLTEAGKPNTIIDRFLAHAAALPAPPRRKGVGMQLDPVNVTIYPDSVWESEKSAIAFGLVSLPKLECCGGRCSCQNNQCNCNQTCNVPPLKKALLSIQKNYAMFDSPYDVLPI